MTPTDRDMQMMPYPQSKSTLYSMSDGMGCGPIPKITISDAVYVPDEPHDFIDPASDGYEFDEIERWDNAPFRWVGIVVLGSIIGAAIFAGIVIGALT